MANQSSKTVGKLTLTTATAVALWYGEVQGQISDGMWENSRPHNHWQFWSQGVEAEVGESNSFTYLVPSTCMKNNYALTRLTQKEYDLSNRMLKLGRLVKAGADPKHTDSCHAEYMPETYEEWKNVPRGDDHRSRRLSTITDEVAQRYYTAGEAAYTIKDLNRDLKAIKAAMAQA